MDTKMGMGKFQKLDSRIRIMLQNGIQENHRTIFVMVGDKCKDQVPIMHSVLAKLCVKSRPSVLWCYKKDLGFSTHRKKVMKMLSKKRKSGNFDSSGGTLFEQFICGTDIRWCYYTETHKILGSTFGMCVLQDFEALTPNTLARTIETVSGGGLIVFLLHSMTSLKQLYTLAMDVHSRYRTEAHQDVVCRFNERFLLSLASNERCLLMDDQWKILPISRRLVDELEPLPPKTLGNLLTKEQKSLKALKTSLESDDSPFAPLVASCITLDQSRALVQFVRAVVSSGVGAGAVSGGGSAGSKTTVVMTAARGRGKSAALGLGITAAVETGLPVVAVSAPSPENLATVMEFVIKGLKLLAYEEHIDYEVTRSTESDHNKAIIRVDIFRKTHHQSVLYVKPWEAHRLGQVDLICIDEAAAIPLPLVQQLLSPPLVFMSSTVNGYEGTGRSLSIKLFSQLRQEATLTTCQDTQVALREATNSMAAAKEGKKAIDKGIQEAGRRLYEIQLDEAIRYGNGDPVEAWLNGLLCLDCTADHILHAATLKNFPSPDTCQLYYVNRDTLFSYHKFSEVFLQRLMALYVASHYKNTPNDLQLLSDAPAHHIFCLLAPYDPSSRQVPEILCVLQVCLEGQISREIVLKGLSRGSRPSGDLIPWTVTQQFCEPKFGELSGCRVVRIATHPDYQGMGYGSRAMMQLQAYYEGMIPRADTDSSSPHTNGNKSANTDKNAGGTNLLTEDISARPSGCLPPLLSRLSERTPESLHYLGVSFGMTQQLLKFWKKSGFMPIYLRQTPNELTGEFSCIMLKQLDLKSHDLSKNWLKNYNYDFNLRLCKLLPGPFRNLDSSYALEILLNKHTRNDANLDLESSELSVRFSSYDLQRLDNYRNNLVDYHVIVDQLPDIAQLYFARKLNIRLTKHQQVILVGLGLQRKIVDQLASELERIITGGPSTAVSSAATDTQLHHSSGGQGGRVLGHLYAVVRDISKLLNSVMESSVEQKIQLNKKQKTSDISAPPDHVMISGDDGNIDIDGAEDIEIDSAAAEERQRKQRDKVARLLMEDVDPDRFAIKGSDQDWGTALSATGSQLDAIKLSIKSTLHEKRKGHDEDKGNKKKKQKMSKKHKK